ncbi:MAG: Gfo/Idh/MocA family oxidoreductase [Bacteroidales bacterium]|nr:Gfo/Idh/MocA family oxidoreductase [Bacteroidales bacterium]
MRNKIRWGILSTAKIGMMKVNPAIQNAENCEVTAIASRDIEKSKLAAEKLGIEKYYGSYEELLADPDIDAIYNPLPNNMHLGWTIKAMDAGKHVLCEKPIGLDSKEAKILRDTAKNYPDIKIMEAFMYRFHPQWKKVKSLIEEGKIGTVSTVHSFFSYNNMDPDNIRNKIEVGGGGLMDIGCYCISFPRFIFGEEPERVVGTMNHDPLMKTDRLTSSIMEFSGGITSTFTCSTQLMPYQRVNILGDKGHIEVEIPVNTPPDLPTRIWLRTPNGSEEIVFDAVDQYTKQAESFARAILEGSDVPTSLDDAIANMVVIDAVVESSKSGKWVSI